MWTPLTNRSRTRALRLSAAILVTILAASLAGCSWDRLEPPRQSSASAQDLPILWSRSGTYSRLTRDVRLVIRDRATLAQVPICQIPVDFETQMVLLAGLGPTPNDDSGIRIKRVWRKGRHLHVLERQIHPGQRRDAGLRPASPWTAVVVPRVDLNVTGYTSQVPKELIGRVPAPR